MDDMGINVHSQVARSYSSAACPLVMRLQISTVTYLTHDGSPTNIHHHHHHHHDYNNNNNKAVSLGHILSRTGRSSRKRISSSL